MKLFCDAYFMKQAKQQRGRKRAGDSMRDASANQPRDASANQPANTE